MKILKFTLFFLLIGLATQAQTTYLPLHSEEEHLLDRLETKSGTLSPYFFGWRPISRKDAINYIKDLNGNRLHGDLSLSKIDGYDIDRAISISSEWSATADGMDGAIPSKKPIFGFFYQVQTDLIHIHTDDLFLVVNPVFYEEAAREKGINKFQYINTRGIEVRGRLFDKIGFYTMLADDQERPASFISSYEQLHKAFPGRGYYRLLSNGNYDMFLAKGYLDAGFFKGYLNVSFGYDDNFSGVGIRSLINSDFAPPATFLRLRGHWRKWGYQSLFLQLTSNYLPGGDALLDRKYAAIHQLGYTASPWLNIGIFESTVFAGLNHLKLTDVIPVIGYQTLAKAAGADQKTAGGIWFKAIAAHKFQFYGQGYLEAISLSKLGGKGWWNNRLGFQLGAKYFDAFGLPNLDLLGEVNAVRPFTYGASDYTAFTHYNQPFTEALGAGFTELILQAKYQPLNKLYLTGKLIYSLKGSNDSLNNGVDPLINWDTRAGNEGFDWLPGPNTKAVYGNINAAYEIRPNIFLEAGITNWHWNYLQTNSNALIFNGGIRWNITRVEHDSY